MLLDNNINNNSKISSNKYIIISIIILIIIIIYLIINNYLKKNNIEYFANDPTDNINWYNIPEDGYCKYITINNRYMYASFNSLINGLYRGSIYKISIDNTQSIVKINKWGTDELYQVTGLDTDNTYLYVANYNNGTQEYRISRIRLSDDQMDNIDWFNFPVDRTSSPPGSFGYCKIYGNYLYIVSFQTIRKISLSDPNNVNNVTSTNMNWSKISNGILSYLCIDTTGSAGTPGQYMFVSDSYNNKIFKINMDTGVSTLWFSNPDSTNKVLDGTFGLGISGQYLYVLSAYTSKIIRILLTNVVIDTTPWKQLPVGTKPIDLCINGSTLYTANFINNNTKTSISSFILPTTTNAATTTTTTLPAATTIQSSTNYNYSVYNNKVNNIPGNHLNHPVPDSKPPSSHWSLYSYKNKLSSIDNNGLNQAYTICNNDPECIGFTLDKRGYLYKYPQSFDANATINGWYEDPNYSTYFKTNQAATTTTTTTTTAVTTTTLPAKTTTTTLPAATTTTTLPAATTTTTKAVTTTTSTQPFATTTSTQPATNYNYSVYNNKVNNIPRNYLNYTDPKSNPPSSMWGIYLYGKINSIDNNGLNQAYTICNNDPECIGFTLDKRGYLYKYPQSFDANATINGWYEDPNYSTYFKTNQTATTTSAQSATTSTKPATNYNYYVYNKVNNIPEKYLNLINPYRNPPVTEWTNLLYGTNYSINDAYTICNNDTNCIGFTLDKSGKLYKYPPSFVVNPPNDINNINGWTENANYSTYFKTTQAATTTSTQSATTTSTSTQPAATTTSTKPATTSTQPSATTTSTQAATGTQPYITYPEITVIKEALKENDSKLETIRYNILDKQEELNLLTNKLNNINFNISSLNKTPKYSAEGALKFY